MGQVDEREKVDQQGGVEREFFTDNLLVQIYFIIEMIWWTGLAPWKVEFPFPSSFIPTFPRGGGGH